MTGDIRNRWAFLVGVNHYRESGRFRRLNHCVNDVVDLKGLLEEVGFTAACLHDHLERDSPRFPDTADTIKAELRKLKDKVGPDDLILVYMACHGTRSLSADDTNPYLILRDTRPTMPKTALAVADLKAEMQALSAQRQILLLDACHMGMGKGDRADSTAAREFVRNVHELATGFTLLTPSTAQQTTQESDQLQHGVFSRFVLDGLGGEAIESAADEQKHFVTVSSLGKYVSNEMVKWSYQNDSDQLPQGYTEGGLGDFIVVDYRQQQPPKPVWREGAAAGGGTELSRSSNLLKTARSDDDIEIKSAAHVSLGEQLNLKDLKQRLANEQQRIANINKEIAGETNFETRERLEARKNNVFETITELDEKIQRLERDYE